MATVEHIDRLVDARELIDARLRLSIVAALTNLTSGTLRKLWKDVHGVRPPNGKLPESVLSFITNVRADADLYRFISG
jgi:flagellar transcriptional activator FlhC